MKYRGQHKQDEFIVNFFNEKTGGVFVDIGAHNGITYSNSYVLEKEFNWKGICIEPMQHQYDELIKIRDSKNYNCAIFDKEGTTDFLLVKHTTYPDMLSGIKSELTEQQLAGIDREVKRLNLEEPELIKIQTRNLNNILEENKFYEIDFLSIDVEGAEYKILDSIDYNKFNIKVIILENNKGDIQILRDLLISKGFKFNSRIRIDDVFVNNNYEG